MGGESPQARASRAHAIAKHAATAEPSRRDARSRGTGEASVTRGEDRTGSRKNGRIRKNNSRFRSSALPVQSSPSSSFHDERARGGHGRPRPRRHRRPLGRSPRREQREVLERARRHLHVRDVARAQLQPARDLAPRAPPTRPAPARPPTARAATRPTRPRPPPPAATHERAPARGEASPQRAPPRPRPSPPAPTSSPPARARRVMRRRAVANVAPDEEQRASRAPRPRAASATAPAAPPTRAPPSPTAPSAATSGVSSTSARG